MFHGLKDQHQNRYYHKIQLDLAIFIVLMNKRASCSGRVGNFMSLRNPGSIRLVSAHDSACNTLSNSRRFTKLYHGVGTLQSIPVITFDFSMLYAKTILAMEKNFRETPPKIMRKYGTSECITS